MEIAGGIILIIVGVRLTTNGLGMLKMRWEEWFRWWKFALHGALAGAAFWGAVTLLS